MSNHNYPFFDLARGHSAPIADFGDPLPESQARLQQFRSLALAARERLERALDRPFGPAAGVPGALDDVISHMWNDGWSPEKGNINLFATDFGLVFVDAIHAVMGGELVFRSDSDITHLSMWYPTFKIEAFPFHHVCKCLLESDGSSLGYFFHALSVDLGSGGQ